MQTVYLLKNCIKCYNALIKLYNNPDLSTNIIIINKNQAKILLLDKRIKSFPFIINTLPTNLGLVPKVANILPLDIFLNLKNNYEHSKSITTKDIPKLITTKNIPKLITTKNIPKSNIFRPQMYNKRETNYGKTNKQPIIKRIKQTDGGVNIILSK